mgnify:CR=1 FL=1
MREVSIKADAAFLAAFADQFLEKHFTWYQKADPNVKKAGFLAIHRVVRFYMMQEELQKLMRVNAAVVLANWVKKLGDIARIKESIDIKVKLI